MYENPLLVGGMVSLPSAQHGVDLSKSFRKTDEENIRRWVFTIVPTQCLEHPLYLEWGAPMNPFYIHKKDTALSTTSQTVDGSEIWSTHQLIYDTYHIIPLFTTGFSTIQPVVVVWDF